jgi:arylformamidase
MATVTGGRKTRQHQPILSRPAMSISGVFDLVPLVQVSTNQGFRLDEPGARKLSPALWPAPRGSMLDAMVGAFESNEFLRQSRLIVDTWAKAGAVTRYEEIGGANHFNVLDRLLIRRA